MYAFAYGESAKRFSSAPGPKGVSQIVDGPGYPFGKSATPGLSAADERSIDILESVTTDDGQPLLQELMDMVRASPNWHSDRTLPGQVEHLLTETGVRDQLSYAVKLHEDQAAGNGNRAKRSADETGIIDALSYDDLMLVHDLIDLVARLSPSAMQPVSELHRFASNKVNVRELPLTTRITKDTPTIPGDIPQVNEAASPECVLTLEWPNVDEISVPLDGVEIDGRSCFVVFKDNTDDSEWASQVAYDPSLKAWRLLGDNGRPMAPVVYTDEQWKIVTIEEARELSKTAPSPQKTQTFRREDTIISPEQFDELMANMASPNVPSQDLPKYSEVASSYINIEGMVFGSEVSPKCVATFTALMKAGGADIRIPVDGIIKDGDKCYAPLKIDQNGVLMAEVKFNAESETWHLLSKDAHRKSVAQGGGLLNSIAYEAGQVKIVTKEEAVEHSKSANPQNIQVIPLRDVYNPFGFARRTPNPPTPDF